MKKVYLAGKISKNDWRHDIFSGLRRYSELNKGYGGYRFDREADLTNDEFVYQGPFFISDDHGLFHGDNTHGRGVGRDSSNTFSSSFKPNSPNEVVRKCYKSIDNSDFIFVWLNKEDAFGTIAEIGYAAAKGKEIFVAVDEKLKGTPFTKDIWFALENAYEIVFVENHLIAWNIFIGKDKKENYEFATSEQINYAINLGIENHYYPLGMWSDDKPTKADVGGIIAYFKDGKKKFKKIVASRFRPFTEEEKEYFEEHSFRYQAKDIVAIIKERFEHVEGFKFSIKKHADIVKSLNAKKNKKWTEVTINEFYNSESVKYNRLWLNVLEEELLEEIKEKNKKMKKL